MRIRVTRWSGPYSTRLPPHRWRTRRGLTVDLVLIDEVRLRRGVVEWSNGVRLDLAGIEFAMRDAAAVGFGMPNNVYVASLRAPFLCKVTAWLDRPGTVARTCWTWPRSSTATSSTTTRGVLRASGSGGYGHRRAPYLLCSASIFASSRLQTAIVWPASSMK
jgi:hypothetical protein